MMEGWKDSQWNQLWGMREATWASKITFRKAECVLAARTRGRRCGDKMRTGYKIRQRKYRKTPPEQGPSLGTIRKQKRKMKKRKTAKSCVLRTGGLMMEGLGLSQEGQESRRKCWATCMEGWST